MKVDLYSNVPAEVEVTVEPKTVDAIFHEFGIGIGEGCAHLQVSEPAGEQVWPALELSSCRPPP